MMSIKKCIATNTFTAKLAPIMSIHLLGGLRSDIEKDYYGGSSVGKGTKCLVVKNLTQNFEFKCRLTLSPRDRKILLAGGMLNYTKNR